ncbi:helix-turn-helix transcriptional regulator [Demequina sp. NBRC 110053]|uniref:helix-turn-helix transcriptional regulator n=1 Tax=Demequina sp. NBRC 110053 TaxID=1570342 RepID=UPI000A0568EB|nr:helix-turn-helix transcriptional regulator [Demequina sp. NBRC 110053]
MAIDRSGLAEFLRLRREALQPEDVGLPRTHRRRTAGLRREEVASLSHLSADYYTRIEQQRGPHPSAQSIAAIAQGLHLSLAERDHLFRLAGHEPPARAGSVDHVPPGMLRVFDRLRDTPAEIVTELGETLLQNDLGVALVGDLTRYSGFSRSIGYRWFDDPSSRDIYAGDQHEFLGHLWTSGLREVSARRGARSRANAMAAELLARSAEFRELWELHEVGIRPRSAKRFVHPSLGVLELTCQTLVDPEHSLSLLTYTATPGTESHEKLRMLGAVPA